ncbi:TonB family protein [Spirosoma endbachense]|uniref:TonB family protein n=1 Tax=Spirosoma endbachense TaxID=2666025 RepID=A0A6P1VTL5_9BACT|nr:TonB family protein [Spirosoma endbachense]QHV95758.1 TonB family protein [Spirosoma endbachense]
MKTLVVYLGILLLSPYLSNGQVIDRSLGNDPDFRQAFSQLIRYPAAAQRAEKVAKAYVEFKVDSQGKVTDVQVLNQANVDASFKEEVNRLMSQLPAQKQAYTGTYVLPIVFELEGSERVIKPQEEERSFIESLPKGLLLEGAYVVAYLN